MGRTSRLGPSLTFFWGGRRRESGMESILGKDLEVKKVGMKIVECTVSAVI